MSKESDCWETPLWLFNELNNEFHFNIDLCASLDNHKCSTWFSDYFAHDLSLYSCRDASCFMNPPYSNPLPFVKKAYEDSKYCRIVCLLKCDTSTKTWDVFWNYGGNCPYCDNNSYDTAGYEDNNYCERCHGTHNYHGPKPHIEVRFLPKRVKFVPPKGYEGKVSSCAFPSCIVIMDRRT